MIIVGVFILLVFVFIAVVHRKNSEVMWNRLQRAAIAFISITPIIALQHVFLVQTTLVMSFVGLWVAAGWISTYACDKFAPKEVPVKKDKEEQQ